MTRRTFVPTRTPEPSLATRLLGVNAGDVSSVIECLENGFAPEVAKRIANHLDLPLTTLFDLLGASASIYHARRRAGRPLPLLTSERLYQLALVLNAADRFFDGDVDAVRRWLFRSNVALGGVTPARLARTSAGAQYVRDMLMRVEHGVYS